MMLVGFEKTMSSQLADLVKQRQRMNELCVLQTNTENPLHMEWVLGVSIGTRVIIMWPLH